MSTLDSRTVRRWRVHRTGMPLIQRRCGAGTCPGKQLVASGKFRMNASAKLLDVWLLALCIKCGKTINLTVVERRTVKSFAEGLIQRYEQNDADLILMTLIDSFVASRNQFTLAWENAWTVDTGDAQATTVDGPFAVEVTFSDPIPLRTFGLIAQGLGLSRSEIKRLVQSGNIKLDKSAAGKISSDFTFVVDPDPKFVNPGPKDGQQPGT